MASLLVLHADEAFWAGDKKNEGVLRDLVSGRDHPLEFKNVDPIFVKNYIRLFVSGNPDWIVPAGFKERRWAIFDIGEDHMQDIPYFAAIDHEMDHGGREALLHYLLNFDLSKINLRSIPKTAALLEQKIESMTPEQAWWFDTLMSGLLPKQISGETPTTCIKQALYERYIKHAQVQGVNHRSAETKLGMFLNSQLGSNLKTMRIGNKTRTYCYILPSLKVCRTSFAAKVGQVIDWGEDWEKQEWENDADWF